jgi:hypothetical protein
MGHGIVLNRIVPYYGSGKKLRHTIGHADNHPPSLNTAAHPSHRHLSLPIKATVQELFKQVK